MSGAICFRQVLAGLCGSSGDVDAFSMLAGLEQRKSLDFSAHECIARMGYPVVIELFSGVKTHTLLVVEEIV